MFKALLVAFLSTQAADTATTVKLHQRPLGAVELNRFLPNRPAAFVAVKSGFMIGETALAWKLRQHHPKVAGVLLGVGAGLGAYATIHNARQLARPR